jgi:hypothetical protein
VYILDAIITDESMLSFNDFAANSACQRALFGIGQ